jgi:glycine/D-amino acid oxidase-like deaminating enzyme
MQCPFHQGSKTEASSAVVTRRDFLERCTLTLGGGLVMAAGMSGCAFSGRKMEAVVGMPAVELGHELREDGLVARLQASFSDTNVTRRSVDVVIVGGGITGLVAAWRCVQAGMSVELLELEPELGGNARGIAHSAGLAPLGAHYVPVPSVAISEVYALFTELGLIDAEGRPQERHLCHAPQERLFYRGRWQTGLRPQAGLSEQEEADFFRFDNLVRQWKNRPTEDGKPALALPLAACALDAEALELDQMTMAQWLDEHELTSAPLRWYVDYACRDDYGADSTQVSAWAGLHYFGARDHEEVFTWPEGNGWITQQLKQRLTSAPYAEKFRWRGSTLVRGIDPSGQVEVMDGATRKTELLQAQTVICATPRFIARRLIAGLDDTTSLHYAPWLVATATLRAESRSPLISENWDNVIYDAPGLGYVMAQHQELAVPREKSRLLTYYRPLDDAEPAVAREQALQRDKAAWAELVLSDLRRIDPKAEREIEALHLWVWGHGMLAPTPGFLSDATRLRAQEPIDRLILAHSDWGGLPLFEEACTQGARAAQLAALLR